MKLLTITIPCYNSQDYMEKSICSALTGGDRVEIIINIKIDIQKNAPISEEISNAGDVKCVSLVN